MTQQDRLDYLEEGKKVRQKLEEERLKIEGIKQRKLNDLQSLGVEQKYQYELAKKKIVWVLKTYSWRTYLWNGYSE